MATDNTAENTATPTAENQAAAGSSEAKTFTQEEVNDIVAKRLARAKAEVPSDYEDLKAAKAELDQIKEANKSDLEKANDKLAKVQSELDALKSQAAHEKAVAEAAAKYGVDADILTLMGKDVEANAQLLADKLKAQGYTKSRDMGEPSSKGADYKHETVAALFGRK